MNKIYIGLSVLVLVILVISGIYWQSQRIAVSSIEKESTAEGELLNQDIAELQGIEQDTSLENLEQDLTVIDGEGVVTETASIKNLENEFALEVSGFSNDLGDLEGFENDTSLDNLDTGLSDVVE